MMTVDEALRVEQQTMGRSVRAVDYAELEDDVFVLIYDTQPVEYRAGEWQHQRRIATFVGDVAKTSGIVKLWTEKVVEDV